MHFAYLFCICAVYFDITFSFVITNFKLKINFKYKHNILEVSRDNSDNGILKRKIIEDPWWLSPKERNNPRILAPYNPWWRTSSIRKYTTSNQARNECIRRGINISQTQNLTGILKLLDAQYDMSDKGYSEAVWIDDS